MERAAFEPAPVLAPQPAPTRGGGIDTTRVLNLFGFVGPVASLMSHSLFPHGVPSPGGGAARSLQRMGGVEARVAARRGAATSRDAAPAPGSTRFVLSRTEDAIDSVLPCAAERVFRRPGKFGNPENLRFSYTRPS